MDSQSALLFSASSLGSSSTQPALLALVGRWTLGIRCRRDGTWGASHRHRRYSLKRRLSLLVVVAELSLGLCWQGSESKYSPVHCRAANTKGLSELGLAVRPQVVQFEQMARLGRLELRLLASQPPLGPGDFMPSRVRRQMRLLSNSATMANTLKSSRPTGSVGSCTELPSSI
jgi:hypothetical protein